ncbi:DUF3592 domain-containing protein [Kordia jejudonensis]|uniref:DUF3592 domain-containing protein n=1 Tax=Kordia jejudonensis TaxID=1348245 RepID=UPI0006291CA0|nr:DUF3592 domain-containing protein [Kordia jejudonensis]
MTTPNEVQLREKPSLIQKILAPALLIFNIYFFFELIPIHIAEAYSTLFAILGGVITLILSFWTADTLFRPILKYIGIPVFILCIASLFIFGYFFILKTTSFSSDELTKNGIQTTAVIIDKSRIYGKRGRTIQSIDVRFTDQNQQRQEATIDIGDSEYNSFQTGMVIPIMYSSEHPNIARISYEKLRSGNY